MMGLLDRKNARAKELVRLWIGFYTLIPKTGSRNQLRNFTGAIECEYIC